MKHTVALGSVLFSLFLGSCGGEDTPTAPTPTPTPVATSITLSVTSLSLASLGATSQLSATVKDQNGATMASAWVTWATSDAAVATVSTSGLVTSVTNGTTTIIVECQVKHHREALGNVIDEALSAQLVRTAEVLSRSTEVTAKEIELWVRHLGLVLKAA